MLETIILVIALLANALLGLTVYTKNPKSVTNRRFFLLTLAICLWAFINFLSVHTSSANQLIIVRYTLFSAAFLNLAVYLTFRVFPKTRAPKDKLFYPAVILTAITMGLTLTPYVFSHLSGGDPVPAPGIVIFVAQTIALLGTSVCMLVRKYHASRMRERQQFKYVIFGLFTTFGLILLSNFVFVIFFHITAFLSFGAAYTLFFTGSVAYAVITQRLFDVRFIIARTITYILVLVVFGGLYVGLAYGSLIVLLSHTSDANVREMVNAVLALVLAFAFQPLRVFFQKITDRIFFRSRYDSQSVLNEFSKILVSELVLDKILKKSITNLCNSLHIQFGQIIVFNNGRVYRIEHFGKLPQRLMVAPELAELNHALLVADELEEGRHKRLMDEHGVRVSMTLHTREEFVGYLLLGDKLSGDIYSAQDLKLLEIIAKQLAVAILNAKAYAQIEEFNRTLQARVDHATNRLRIANRHLKELDRAKDEFISMASHQLRTPLTTIKGYLSMMLEGDAGKLTPPQKEFVGYAFGSSERMVNLISDLLNVSRLSAGRFLIQTKPTNMVQMIEDEVRQLKTHATAKNIKLIFEAPKELLPPAEIDENKTRQVVMNFIDNAIYYTQQGEVRVVLEQSGNCVRLEVRDSGIGVPEDAKKKLFSKFFRAGNAQTVRPDGTGLGLYLAKRVVEDQGGTIIFNSVEGKGSTFGFELPFKPVTPIREEAHAK